jgi:hypothetical protein
MHISESSVDSIASARRPLFDVLPEVGQKSNTLTPEERESRIARMSANVDAGLQPDGEPLPDGITARHYIARNGEPAIAYSDDNDKTEFVPGAIIHVDESDFR